MNWVGVHGDPHAAAADQGTDGGEARGELLRPGEEADRVRGEGDQVGGEAEEEQAVVAVELQDALQAVQVPAHGFGEASGGIGGQAEGAAGGAADGAVEAGVADLHPGFLPAASAAACR